MASVALSARHVAAPAVLVALPVVLFLPLVLGTGVIAAGDALHYNYPLLHAMTEQWRQGVAPLWNPHVFGGQPLLAFQQAGAVYPPNALCFLRPLWWSMQLTVVLHYVLCGLFAFLFLRRIGLSRWPALAGGIVFELCGFGQQHVAMATNLRALPWLPLFLYAVEGLAQRGRWRDVAVGAVAIALALTSGHPQVNVYALGITALYGLFALRRVERPRRRAYARSLALLFALGLGLAGVQLVPALAVVGETFRPMSFHGAVLGSEHPLSWIRCVFPQAFWPTDWTLFGSYNGVAASVFLGAFLLSARRGSGPFFGLDERVAFFLVLWLVANVLALGDHLPHGRALARIALLGTFRAPMRFEHLAAVSAAVVVAFGLQRALGEPRFRRALLASASLVVVVAGIVAVALGPLFREGPAVFPFFGTLPVRSLSDPLLVRGYVALALTWAAVAFLCRRPHARLAPALVVAALALDLGQYARVTGASQITTPEELAEPPPALPHLARVAPGQRVMGFVEIAVFSSDEAKALLWQQVPALYALESVNGHDSLLLERLVLAAGLRLKNWGQVEPRFLNDRGLRVFSALLGARYLLLRPRTAPPLEPPLVSAWKGRLVEVLENPDALPRLFAVDEARPATRAAALDAVATGLHAGEPWDPARLAWLEGVDTRELPAALTDAERPRVTVRELGPGRARGEVSGPAPFVLVHATPFARGWRATVDGRAVPVRCADGFLQAIVVPAGAHVVEFRYAPRSFPLGVALSALSALLLVAGGFTAPRARRSSPAPAGPAGRRPATR